MLECPSVMSSRYTPMEAWGGGEEELLYAGMPISDVFKVHRPLRHAGGGGGGGGGGA